MKPQNGSKLLRKGRASIKNQHYLITATVLERNPVFNQAKAAEMVLKSLHGVKNRGKSYRTPP
jgi:hypothetical protein